MNSSYKRPVDAIEYYEAAPLAGSAPKYNECHAWTIVTTSLRRVLIILVRQYYMCVTHMVNICRCQCMNIFTGLDPSFHKVIISAWNLSRT